MAEESKERFYVKGQNEPIGDCVEIDWPFSVLQRYESEAAALVLLAVLLIAWLTYLSGRRLRRERSEWKKGCRLGFGLGFAAALGLAVALKLLR